MFKFMLEKKYKKSKYTLRKENGPLKTKTGSDRQGLRAWQAELPPSMVAAHSRSSTRQPVCWLK